MTSSQQLLLYQPQPCFLSDFTKARREPVRPSAFRLGDFEKDYDRNTLVYDAYWSENPALITLICPPLHNLKSEFGKIQIQSKPKSKICSYKLIKLDRLLRVEVQAPADTKSITFKTSIGTAHIPVRQNHLAFFENCRVLFTKSKNNELEWIKDWIRFHRDLHGANGVLIYDNHSTKYSTQALLNELSNISGMNRIAVVQWPYTFGPPGIDTRRYWDSDYSEYGILEHGRSFFLQNTHCVLSIDIDELVLSHSGRSIFEATEESNSGLTCFHGRWVVGISRNKKQNNKENQIRHKDFTTTERKNLTRKLGLFFIDSNRCPKKWAATPSKIPHNSQWRTHRISRFLPAFFPSNEFSYRHFRELTTNWKYKRSGCKPFDNRLHYRDKNLISAYERVDWKK